LNVALTAVTFQLEVEGTVQAPFVQAAGELQALQAAPLVPHCEEVSPVSHTPAAQHPVEQVVGPHDGVASQLLVAPHVFPPTVQSAHAPPPVPQAASWSPLVHVSALQQPVPQELGPQVDELTHAPKFWSHVFPCAEQSAHFTPPAPQAVSSMELTHWLPSQHVPQVAVPQDTPPWQVPVTQA
jgi:hypothetical protein